MATRSYAAARRREHPNSIERVLEAAEHLIRTDTFHTTTMDDLAAAAGVSRATIFNRFGSKLGVLQALFTRAMESPEMAAIQHALTIDDPVASLHALTGATCAIWEAHSFIHEQLQAIVVLEPDARTLVDKHKEDQRTDLQTLTRRLARANRLRAGLSEIRATATLHTLTSVETFLWLRREYMLSLRQTRETIAEQVRALLRD